MNCPPYVLSLLLTKCSLVYYGVNYPTVIDYLDVSVLLLSVESVVSNQRHAIQ